MTNSYKIHKVDTVSVRYTMEMPAVVGELYKMLDIVAADYKRRNLEEDGRSSTYSDDWATIDVSDDGLTISFVTERIEEMR